jgi:hypothetical protein
VAGWRLETDSLFFITTLHGPRRKHNLSLVAGACLQRLCIATEVTQLLLAHLVPRECVLPSPLLAMDVSGFTIPAVGRHVTVLTDQSL